LPPLQQIPRKILEQDDQSSSLEFGTQQAESAVSGQSQQVSVAENGTEQKPGDGVALPSGVMRSF
jgi:hypothetical protein